MMRIFKRRLLTAVSLFTKHLLEVPTKTYIWFTERKIPRKLSPEFKNSLGSFSSNKYSQVGQDGIIEEIFKRLQISSGTFCEFGAWDGIHLSNARKLVDENWIGVFIEGDSDRYKKLVQNYPSEEIIKVNAWVGYRTPSENFGTPLGELLLQFVSNEFIKNLDLLVIDVDGVDLEIAISSMVQAKVLVIEGGSSFVPSINVPFPDAARNFQHPLKYIISQLEEIGYTPVCFRQDLFLVRKDLANQVTNGERILSPEQLFTENFYALPRFERRWQMNRRCNSKNLRQFEIEALGKFHPNPLNGLR